MKREEVEQFLTDKFDIYDIYNGFLLDRPNMPIAYYPDLKI